MSLETAILNHETPIRFGFFFGTFALMTAWEFIAPLRVPETSKAIRWPNHLALAATNIFVARVLFPLAAVGLAIYARELGIGVFNMVAVPYGLAFFASLLMLDLAVYLFHLLFHAVPILWRVHRGHHSDLDIDVSTGLRFHPVQMMLAGAVKSAIILALGPPALAVLLFEIAAHAITLFNHGNVAMPPSLDRVLRWIVVTPDMHRIHHSIHNAETDSNFGFILPWWDHLSGTYRAEPAANQTKMVAGIDSFRTDRDQRLDRLIFNQVLVDRNPKVWLQAPVWRPNPEIPGHRIGWRSLPQCSSVAEPDNQDWLHFAPTPSSQTRPSADGMSVSCRKRITRHGEKSNMRPGWGDSHPTFTTNDQPLLTIRSASRNAT